MNASLAACHDWLARRYSQLSGHALGDAGFAHWGLWNRDSFPPVPASDANAVGVLEDAELGLSLLFFPLLDGDVGSQVEADVNVALRWRLGPQVGEPDGAAWRVCVHWLVPEALRSAWQEAIMDLRQRSGAVEEIAVDAVFIPADMGFTEALDSHGLPRLLFATRTLFQRDARETEAWKSADEDVRQVLAGFAECFSTPREKAIATEIERIASTYAAKTPASLPERPTSLASLHVENFRCINSMTLGATAEESRAKAWIVFGANGTGKTALAEALAIRAFGASRQYLGYLEDRDEPTPKSARFYTKRYLAPLADADATPLVSANAEPPCPAAQLLCDKADAENAHANSAGTILSQEDAVRFASLESAELASQIAGHCSDLADRLLNHVEQHHSAAQARRVAFNRQHGLNAATKLRETLFSRIAERALIEALPRTTSDVTDYLRLRIRLNATDAREAENLAEQWSHLDDKLREHGRRLAMKCGAGEIDTAHLAQALRMFIDGHNALIAETQRLLARPSQWHVAHHAELAELRHTALVWAEWLAQPAQAGTPAEAPTDADAPERRLGEALKAREDVERHGKSLRKRFDHLAASLDFLPHWEKEHPGTCPTCASDVAERGGIRQVVEGLREDVEAALAQSRHEYEALTQAIRELEAKLKASGQSLCPVPEASRQQLGKALAVLIGKPFDVAAWLALPERRRDMGRLFDHAGTPPTAPQPVDAAKAACDIAASVAGQWREAAQIAAEPDAWEYLRKSLQNRMQAVVAAHLPNTVERVWWEIAASLTSAPWLLPERVHIQMESRRHQQHAYLTTQDRLARHLLNCAELHTLGLAWTFTRHLLHGRFRHAWLLLDDPGHAMDQASFHSLSRFLATLSRLHGRGQHDFTLLVLLHQQQRALDLARMMDSGLYLLGWAPRQQEQAEAGAKPTVRWISPSDLGGGLRSRQTAVALPESPPPV